MATRSSDGKFEWQIPTGYTDEPYSGEMVHFTSRAIDLLVTPNHRILHTSGNTSSHEIVARADVCESLRTGRMVASSQWVTPDLEWWTPPTSDKGYFVLDRDRLRSVREDRGFTRKQLAVAASCSEAMISRLETTASSRCLLSSMAFVESVCGILQISTDDVISHPSPEKISGDDFAAFMGMYLSEGCVTTSSDGYRRIYISQKPYSKGYEPFRDLLIRLLGSEPYYDGSSWSFAHDGLAQFLQTCGSRSWNKTIPGEVLALSARQLAIFWEFFVLGDGYRGPTTEAIITTSEQMANQLQEVAQKMGYSATVSQRRDDAKGTIRGREISSQHPAYRISLLRTKRPRWTGTERVKYDSRVYCVTVPNSIVYVRRNGKAIWSGNSFQNLRALADSYSVARSCITLRQNEILGMEWDIGPTSEAEKQMYGDHGAYREFNERRQKLISFFRRPDPAFHDYHGWMRAILEDLFVIDAVSIYMHPSRRPGKGLCGSDLAALDVLDGTTVRPLLDLRGGPPIPPNPCFSSDTEVLTQRGWITFDLLTTDDTVATRSPSGQFEWQQPSRTLWFPYTGDMVWLHSSRVDQFVTPNHQVLYRSSKGARDLFAPADYVANLTTATIPVTSNYDAPDMVERSFEIDSSKARKITMTGDQFAAFMGMYLSEGCVVRTPKEWRVIISQTQKGKGYEEFRQLLIDILGHEPRHAGGSWTFGSRALGEYLGQFGKSKEKWIPREVLDLSKRQLEIFWHYYFLGDGNYCHDQEVIATASKKMADGLQEVAQKLGYGAAVREYKQDTSLIYKVSLRRTTHPEVASSRVPYDGYVGCATVPNGTLLVRRNGQMCWSGNCYQQYLWGVPRVDLMDIILEADIEGMSAAKVREYRGDQLLYLRYYPRDWTPYGLAPIEQAIIPIMAGLSKQQYTLNYFDEGCHDAETEVLTDQGWKFFADLDHTERVATYSPDGKFEWQTPTAYQRYDWDGDLLHFKSDTVDVMVTPSHRMMVASRTHRNGQRVLSEWRFHTAQECTDKSELYIAGTTPQGYEGHDTPFKVIPSATQDLRDSDCERALSIVAEMLPAWRQNCIAAVEQAGLHPSLADWARKRLGCKTMKIGRNAYWGEPNRQAHPAVSDGWTIDMHSWCQFVGLFVAEGYLRKQRKSGHYDWTVALAQSEKGKLIEFEKILGATPFNWSKRERENGVYEYTCNSRTLWETLHECGDGAHNKRFPSELLDLASPYIEDLLYGFYVGDGSLRANGSRSFATSSKVLADQIQEAFFKTGRVGNLCSYIARSPYGECQMFAIAESPREHRLLPQATEVPYRGEVFCVSVPNTTLVTRRHGKSVVLGQSIPGMFITAGPDLNTPTQIANFQHALNSIAGDIGYKHKIIVLPPGCTPTPIKPVSLADDFDQLVMEWVLMAFDIQPFELGIIITRSAGASSVATPTSITGAAVDAQNEAAKRKSLRPLLMYLKYAIFDLVIRDICGMTDMEWKWKGLTDDPMRINPEGKARQYQTLIASGILSVDEVREEIGRNPWGKQATSEPVYVAPSAPLPTVWNASEEPITTTNNNSPNPLDQEHEQAVTHLEEEEARAREQALGMGSTEGKPGLIGRTREHEAGPDGRTRATNGPTPAHSSAKTPPTKRPEKKSLSVTWSPSAHHAMMTEFQKLQRIVKKGRPLGAFKPRDIPLPIWEAMLEQEVAEDALSHGLRLASDWAHASRRDSAIDLQMSSLSAPLGSTFRKYLHNRLNADGFVDSVLLSFRSALKGIVDVAADDAHPDSLPDSALDGWRGIQSEVVTAKMAEIENTVRGWLDTIEELAPKVAMCEGFLRDTYEDAYGRLVEYGKLIAGPPIQDRSHLDDDRAPVTPTTGRTSPSRRRTRSRKEEEAHYASDNGDPLGEDDEDLDEPIR